MTSRAEWSWGDESTEVRVMALPGRGKALYLVVHDDDGMRTLARFRDDAAAREFVAWAWLDTRIGDGS